METMDFKALALQRLQGNRQGNHKETFGFHKETSKETFAVADKSYSVNMVGVTGGGIGSKDDDGKLLPHYCQQGDCWCSERLPEANYPAGCVRSNCRHYNVGRPPEESFTPGNGELTAATPAAQRPCYACKSTDYWQSAYGGHLVCRKCHPPAPGAEVTP